MPGGSCWVQRILVPIRVEYTADSQHDLSSDQTNFFLQIRREKRLFAYEGFWFHQKFGEVSNSWWSCFSEVSNFYECLRRIVKFFRSYGEKKQRTYSSLLNPSFDFSTKSRSKPVFVLCGEKKKKKRVSESASAAFSSRLKTQNIKSVSPMWLLLH
jgi:hypothetical protein